MLPIAERTTTTTTRRVAAAVLAGVLLALACAPVARCSEQGGGGGGEVVENALETGLDDLAPALNPKEGPALPRQYGSGYGGGGGGGSGRCPLCDSSVYSYCSYKVLHDACCCEFAGAPHAKPQQCHYFDCTLLYAKSCYEHTLIRDCCCNNPYR